MDVQHRFTQISYREGIYIGLDLTTSLIVFKLSQFADEKSDITNWFLVILFFVVIFITVLPLIAVFCKLKFLIGIHFMVAGILLTVTLVIIPKDVVFTNYLNYLSLIKKDEFRTYSKLFAASHFLDSMFGMWILIEYILSIKPRSSRNQINSDYERRKRNRPTKVPLELEAGRLRHDQRHFETSM